MIDQVLDGSMDMIRCTGAFTLDEHRDPLNIGLDYLDEQARDLVHPARGLLRSERDGQVDYKHSGSPTLVHPLLKTTAPITGHWTSIESVPLSDLFTGFIGRLG